MLRVSRRLALLLLIAALAGAVVWAFSARDQNPPAAPPDLDAVLSAIQANDLAHARELLDALLEAQPDHPQALLYRGQVRREHKDLEGALRDWRRVPDDPPHFAGTARFLEGTGVLERGLARRAEELFLRAIELHPTYLQPRERLVDLYVVQMRRRELHEQLDAIAGMRPLSLREAAFRIAAPERATTPESGLSLMRSYVAGDSGDHHSRVALAAYLVESEQYADAAEVLEELLAERPDDSRAAGLLAEALVKSGRVEAAAAATSSFEPARESSSWLWRGLGQIAAARGDWPRAAECFARVVEAEPEDSASLYQLGRALQRLGETEQAQAILLRAKREDELQREALRLAWGDDQKRDLVVPILTHVADLLLTLERPVEAGQWYDRALAIEPANPAARDGSRLARRAAQRPGSSGALAARVDGAPAARVATSSETSPQTAARAERSEGPDAPLIQLRDMHDEAGIDFVYFNGESGFKYLVESTGGGVGVIDYDGDGWPDLYFPQGCRIPQSPGDTSRTDRLYRNRGDGTFTEVTGPAGTQEYRYGQGCTAGDYDNDGFADLVVANYGRNTFYRNNGDGTFTDITEEAGLIGEEMSSSLALADLDRDGFLDLYVANYTKAMKVCRNADGTYGTCNPSNFEGEPDRLFHNRADGTFEDVTTRSGAVGPDGKGLGIIVADFDEDGWPDVYVANDTTPNFLFRNRTAESGELRFVEEGLLSGTALSGDGRAQAGMGIACADLDGNGLLDLHVTNFYQETNTLYLNLGNGVFADETRSAGLATPTFPLLGFGTQAVDFDLDGWPDLFVANGHIDDFSARGEPWKMPPQLFRNEGAGRFSDVSEQSGSYFGGANLGRGVARVDWNRDALPDLVVVHQDRPVALLKNETAVAGRSVVVELRGVDSNRDAIGTRLRATCGGRTQVLEVCGGDGFFASNDRRQIIGLGPADQIDELQITWPSGRTDVLREVPAGSLIRLTEGAEPRAEFPHRPDERS